ncbi:MAG: TIGR03564 family F420-dependent LLM class oxidoreductase [Myxococcota bacterium]
MRIGVMVGGSAQRLDVEALIQRARELEARGFATIWIPHVFGMDAVTAAAVVGRETERIEIGTAVVPTYPRHPTVMAQQALTAASASGRRFSLGIGLSHPAVIEGMLGLSYARRVSHMREYLAVLGPLLRGETVAFDGSEFRVHETLDVPDAAPVPLLLAALGPRMLDLAAREADGTILWMAGPRTIEKHVMPRLREAATRAGRTPSRVVAGMHIALTDDPDAGHARVAELLALYRQMPSYGALLEIEGEADPQQMALIGDEANLEKGLRHLANLGVDDFEASVLPLDPATEERTLAFLAEVRVRA